MRTELHQKLLANVILSTKSETLTIKRFRQSSLASGAVFYIGAFVAAALGLVALVFSKFSLSF